MDRDLVSLVERVWSELNSNEADYVVRPSLPILFFGDLATYLESDIKIITVGLNPSCAEFPTGDKYNHDPFCRFPAARILSEAGLTSSTDTEAYIEALSSYFRTKPYSPWFNRAFESILQGAGASFYGGKRIAVHTDLCSPLATSPTWSGLSPDERASLTRAGITLWHDLVEYLQPDLAFVSVARRLLEMIGFGGVSPWQLTYRVERTNPYDILTSSRALRSGKQCRFVFGRAANHPFGTLRSEDQRRVGAALMEIAHG